MEFKDYYKIMGVARDADARFKVVGEAYAVLKDLEKRAAYDQLGSNWKAGQDFRPPPDWNAVFEYSSDGSGGSAGDFSDFFESLYGRGFDSGGQRHQSFNARGADHHSRVLSTSKTPTPARRAPSPCSDLKSMPKAVW